MERGLIVDAEMICGKDMLNKRKVSGNGENRGILFADEMVRRFTELKTK